MLSPLVSILITVHQQTQKTSFCPIFVILSITCCYRAVTPDITTVTQSLLRGRKFIGTIGVRVYPASALFELPFHIVRNNKSEVCLIRGRRVAFCVGKQILTL